MLSVIPLVLYLLLAAVVAFYAWVLDVLVVVLTLALSAVRYLAAQAMRMPRHAVGLLTERLS